jgi:hypothetical protein
MLARNNFSYCVNKDHQADAHRWPSGCDNQPRGGTSQDSGKPIPGISFDGLTPPLTVVLKHRKHHMNS